MAWRVDWTETAWTDLEEIAAYIARDSEHYMAAFIRRARDVARSLQSLPHRGRHVPEFGHRSVRELLFGNYRMIYQIEAAVVNILGIVHGARDLKALWEREERLLPPEDLDG